MLQTLDAPVLASSQHPPVDLRDPGWLLQPRTLGQALRLRGPVHRDVTGTWLLVGHADCRAAMQSSQLSRDPRRWKGYGSTRPFVAGSALEQAAERFMLFNDPPQHTRLRRVVAAAFTPPAIRELRQAIATACDGLLDALPDHEPFDFMAAFARRLPVLVMCDMLGLDEGDRAQTQAWSDAIAQVVEPLATRAQREDGAAAVEGLTERLRRQVAARRRSGGRCVLDRMIAAQREDPGFDDDLLLANLILLFIAGHETTTNLLGNGLLALLQHPRQLALLRREPDVLPGAVDELLRFESPVNMVARITVQPWTAGGQLIPPGEMLYCMVGVANHDPAVFDDPLRLDIRRASNPQLSFGGGVHYCVGAPLARLEAALAFEALLRRFAVLELADPGAAPRWRPMINLRGLETLRLCGRR